MNKQKILFVLTNHDRLGPASDTSADKTGFHLAEAAKSWAVLTEAGYAIDLASPKGGKAPIDPSSRDLDDEVNVRFMSDANMASQIDNTHALKDVQLGDYAAIYFPGGHGTMWDFPESDDIQSAIRTMYEDGKVVAAVCHGPAAFVNVKLSDGSWFVNGKTLSTFTNEEERAVEKDSLMPFLLEEKLKSRGARIEKGGKFEKSVSVDQRVVSGQNPASAMGVGEGIRDLLKEQKVKAA